MLPRTIEVILTGWLLLAGMLLSTLACAAPVASAKTASTKTATSTGIVINQQLHQQIQQNTARLAQLEQANQDALARNQELQLMNDNLTVQVQVLQSERSAQMFLYGAVTLAVGAFIGFILANYILSKRTRRW
ncbi:hypothetical protein [Alkanindiges illinoisensis]|uniref:hypothetical protein n=1 Tax=Alkanindiges illinoisensis TaxID=197183 RepID=UPI0012EB3004